MLSRDVDKDWLLHQPIGYSPWFQRSLESEKRKIDSCFCSLRKSSVGKKGCVFRFLFGACLMVVG